MSKTTTKRLYEIQMTAYKTFYVEAESQEDALDHPAVEDESSSFGNDVDWEHDETRAEAVTEERAASIRARRPKEILSAE